MIGREWANEGMGFSSETRAVFVLRSVARCILNVVRLLNDTSGLARLCSCSNGCPYCLLCLVRFPEHLVF